MLNPEAPIVPVVAPLPTHQSHKLYIRRWFIVIAVMLLNMSNALTWNSFSSIAASTKEYYDIDFSSVNMLSLVFMIITIPVGFVAIWSLDSLGVRLSLTIAAFLNAIGPVLRLLTVFDFVPMSAKYPLLLAGQCIAAFSQAFLLFCSPKLAQYWFPDSQRALANTLGTMSNPLGILLSAVLSPIILQKPSDMQYLMIAYTSPAVLALIVTLLALTRSKPETPPSDSAKEISEPFLQGVKIVIKNKMYLLLMACFGTGMAVFTALSALMMQILCPYGYGETYAGMVIGIMVGVGFVGAALTGFIADATKKFLEVAKIAFGLAIMCLCAFTIIVIYPNQHIALAVVLGAFGFFGFGQYAICLEMAVETTFPVAEATSAGLLVISGQIQSALFVGVMQPLGIEVPDDYGTCSANVVQGGDALSYIYGNMLLLGAGFLAGIGLIAFYDCPYKRLTLERKRAAHEPSAAQIPVATDNDRVVIF